MEAFLRKLDEIAQDLSEISGNVKWSGKRRDIIRNAEALKKLVRDETAKLDKLPSMAITAMDSLLIPIHFNLIQSPPEPFELAPSDAEKVSPARYLNSILVDYSLATGYSPSNEVLIRSRIDAILLITLANMKRLPVQSQRSSIGSVASVASDSTVRSLHLQFEREIKFPWVVNKQKVRVSGVVDYSLWYGNADNYATNMAMVEAKRPGQLQLGVYQCIGYMAMIHHTRKQAKVSDTSIYGIATDSFEWVFIRIRQDGHYATKSYEWIYSSAEIVSMLYKIFRHAAGFDPPLSRKRWNTGSETEYSTSLENPAAKARRS